MMIKTLCTLIVTIMANRAVTNLEKEPHVTVSFSV